MISMILQTAAALIMSLTQPNGDSVPDFSRVGYRWGDMEIPEYKVVTVLEAPEDGSDATAMIQAAIDAHKGPGAVLLKAGKYNVSGTIKLNKSNLVLRGEGDSTIIYGTGKEQRTLVEFGNKGKRELNDDRKSIITGDYTPVGQMYVTVDEPELFKIGDRVVVSYFMNDDWIHEIKMDQIPQNQKGNVKQWTAEEFKFYWERIITDIQGDRIYLENPIVQGLDPKYGTAHLMLCSWDRISESGVENLVFDTEFDPSVMTERTASHRKGDPYMADEEHAWLAIKVGPAEHCWIRGVKSYHMGFGLARLATGVRVIEQKDGVLYINHKPDMLNGAQNFGYRLPIEDVSVTIRCATDDMVMRDLMMAEKLGGNLLRVHVHAEKDIVDGINDPRYAEYADQMGIYLIWQSAGWLREGEAWNVDIENWPAYMRQVYNHPSIVLWEASNHPNCFKNHDVNDTEDYFNAIITAMVQADTSRLISPTSFWPHSHYANYDGTLTYQGDTIAPNLVLMHKMMTRGSQDAYTGYGEKWTTLRKFPYPWAQSCLEAKDLCYFNFEHEESAAQPNWSLARKDPWFEVQSYEWEYEEGSIGRLLQVDEWRESQAFQAFSAWESMKLQTLAGVCGFSWCSLESGANMFTYQKPLVDCYYVPKLAFHANKMVFGRIWAASDDVDTVYGPSDMIRPVVFNLGDACLATLVVELCNEMGKVIERRTFKDVNVEAGRSVTRLEPFRFKTKKAGCYFVVYKLSY